MAPKDFRIKCPKCEEIIIVDARTGKIIRNFEPGKEGDDEGPDPALFDQALGKVKKVRGKGDSIFDSAFKKVKDHRKELDDLFREAKKKADEKGDEIDPKERPDFWD